MSVKWSCDLFAFFMLVEGLCLIECPVVGCGRMWTLTVGMMILLLLLLLFVVVDGLWICLMEWMTCGWMESNVDIDLWVWVWWFCAGVAVVCGCGGSVYVFDGITCGQMESNVDIDWLWVSFLFLFFVCVAVVLIILCTVWNWICTKQVLILLVLHYKERPFGIGHQVWLICTSCIS